ncbi:hypothetical protein Emag_000179 [Eimeria magna]
MLISGVFDSEDDFSSLHARPAAAHGYSWSPSASSPSEPTPSASWLELTTDAGTQTPPDNEPTEANAGTQTTSDNTVEASAGGALSSRSQVDASEQTEDTSQQGQRDQGSGYDEGAAGQAPSPDDSGDSRPVHPVIQELSDTLKKRNENPAVYYGDVDGTQEADASPSPPPYQGPPPYSQATDMGDQGSSQGGPTSPDDGSEQQAPPGPPADPSPAQPQWAGEDSGNSDSSQTLSPDGSYASQGSGDSSYDSSEPQSPQDGQRYGPPPPPPTGGDDQSEASGGEGDDTSPPNVPTDPKGLVVDDCAETADTRRVNAGKKYSAPGNRGKQRCTTTRLGHPFRSSQTFFNNARKEETEGRVEDSLSLEEKVEAYLKSPKGEALRKFDLNALELMSCGIYEGPFGLRAFANEWFRAFYTGKKDDKVVPDFDRIFNLGEASSLYYGSVLDERDDLRSKLKKRSESKFGRKRAKEAAVRQYAMTGLVAIAEPPHLDDVMIKAILDQFDFDDCASITKVSIQDGKGKTKKIDVADLRHRALAKMLSLTIRAAPNPQDVVSAHNHEVLVNYVGSFDQYGAVSKLIQQQTTAIPGRHPAPQDIVEGLVQYLQERTETTIYACLRLRELKQGGFTKFVKKNKLLRSAVIGYMSLLLKLGTGFMRRAAREFKGVFADPNISFLPPIPVSADAIAWLEGARVQARQTLFTRDAKAARFDSSLCIEVMRHTLGSVTSKEQKAMDKAQKKMDKNEKKQMKSGGKKSFFSKVFKRKKGGGGNEGGGDEPSVESSFTPDQPPLDKKAAKALKKEEKRRAKEQKKADKAAKKQQKKAEKEEKKQQKKAQKEEKKQQKKADKEAKKQQKKAQKEEKKLRKQQDKQVQKQQKQEQKDFEKQQKQQQKEFEKQQKEREKAWEKQQKEQAKAEKKLQKQQEKEAKKQQKEEEKQRKKEEKERKKQEKNGGGGPETQFLQVDSFPSSPSLLAIRPHNPWAIEKDSETSSQSLLQTKTRISARTKTIIGVSIAIVGAAGFIATIVLGVPIVPLVILLAISLAEFYLFF